MEIRRTGNAFHLR